VSKLRFVGYPELKPFLKPCQQLASILPQLYDHNVYLKLGGFGHVLSHFEVRRSYSGCCIIFVLLERNSETSEFKDSPKENKLIFETASTYAHIRSLLLKHIFILSSSIS